MTEHRHGTINGYKHHGCRCALCTEANTQRSRRWRQLRVSRSVPDYRDPTYVSEEYNCTMTRSELLALRA